SPAHTEVQDGRCRSRHPVTALSQLRAARHPAGGHARHMDVSYETEKIAVTYPDDPYRPAQPRFTPALPEHQLPPTSMRRRGAQQDGYTQQSPLPQQQPQLSPDGRGTGNP